MRLGLDYREGAKTRRKPRMMLLESELIASTKPEIPSRLRAFALKLNLIWQSAKVLYLRDFQWPDKS
jgi:hypothetical protein